MTNRDQAPKDETDDAEALADKELEQAVGGLVVGKGPIPGLTPNVTDSDTPIAATGDLKFATEPAKRNGL